MKTKVYCRFNEDGLYLMNNCDAPGLIPISHALERMLGSITPINRKESVDLIQANNRVLANSIVSTLNVPPADNSAMDGYALNAADLADNDQLELIGTAFAGQPFSEAVPPGACVRIMTGAVIPDGANAVVMQEQTTQQDKLITFSHKPRQGENVRHAGEDIKNGSVVVKQGTLLTPAYLSLIASIGIASCEVYQKPKVGLIATGDELTAPGKPLEQGAIYESNRFALSAMLQEFGAEIIDYGIVEDSQQALQCAFQDADKRCDLILSSGGVSVGDADYVKQVLEKLGSINFWKVAIKPGKPFAFGRLSRGWFCGLPGNPVSSFVTFEQLVMPVLAKLSGRNGFAPLRLPATAMAKLKKRPGRADFQRGIFYQDENGKLLVKANGKQGSGVMSSVAYANCYIVLDKDSGDVAEGTEVFIQPFSTIMS